MTIGFIKMHGLGNDFVVIDNSNGKIKFSPEQIRALCDRHKGIGADGLILVEKGEGADAFMNYYNADGSEAEMCGNGIRCVAHFIWNEWKKDKNDFKILTRAGLKEVQREKDGTYSVNMGEPVFEHVDFPRSTLQLEGLNLDFVSMGNPHAIAFVEKVEGFDLATVGPKIEKNKNFPNKINFEIVEIKSPNELFVRVWERGVGETLACGTGACAVYALARKTGKSGKELTINLPGGKLYLSENKEGEIIMRGEAKSVFSGLFSID